MLSSLEDGILILALVIRHLHDDRADHDEDWWLLILGGSSSLEVSSQILPLVSALPLLLPILGSTIFGQTVPEVALLLAREASSLSLLFPVNVKEKILDLQGHTHYINLVDHPHYLSDALDSFFVLRG
jgi:hypothetical protein